MFRYSILNSRLSRLVILISVIGGMVLVFHSHFNDRPSLSFKMYNTSYLLKLHDPNENEIFENPSVRQEDTKLLAYIRRHHVYAPPSVVAEPEYFVKYYGNPSYFRVELDIIFGRKTGGFFIEAGANDGIFLSNTLGLESELGWTGLLIEPNKFVFHNLRKMKRNAWISNACLALGPTPQKDVPIAHFVGKKFNGDRRGAAYVDPSGVALHQNKFVVGSNTNGGGSEGLISAGNASCFPLYSLLLSIGMPNVDYFSLDVQGIELKILKTIPFDKVQINVITVEHNCIPEGKEAMREFLLNVGYRVYSESDSDFIFVHRRFQI